MSEKSPRVLLIDDDLVDCEVARRLLRGGYLLSETPTGIQGVEAVSSTRPDCVLLSTRLPDTDALEVLDQIVRQSRVVPVVLMAEAGDEEIAERGMAGGASGFVSKVSLTAHNLRAAIELALRAASLQRDLENARRELGLITGNLTKELRSSLQHIAESSHELRTRLASHLDDRSAADLAFIQERALEMSAGMDDLVEYTLVGTAVSSAGWVDLNEVIRQVLDKLDEAVRQTSACIEVEPLPMVWGDTPSLIRLLMNLLSNSIKFHGHGSPVVRVSSHLKDGEWEISIQDNGIGIDPGRQSTIFRPLDPIDAGPSSDGRGLGLATSARIVEQHGGRIRVFSNPGAGSIFRFTLRTPPEGLRAPSTVVDGPQG
jgi:signal transduction histidine kinase